MRPNQVDQEKWKEFIIDYNDKRKNISYKTKLPNTVTHKQVKAKESEFNTVLAKYNDQQKEKTVQNSHFMRLDPIKKKKADIREKYSQGFDIINLDPQRNNLPNPDGKRQKRRILPRAQVDYNILTNTEFEDFYWNGMKKPEKKKEYVKKINMDVFRDYNIVTNRYWNDHKEKTIKDLAENRAVLDNKYWEKNDFDPIKCTYYDQGKETNFQDERTHQSKIHGKDFNDRLPPTLKVREAIYFDPTKEIPDEIKKFDIMKKNQKKRYELRYKLENEYRDKDVASQIKKDELALNRYNGAKFYTEKLKGYDSINFEGTKEKVEYLNKFARTKQKKGVWEKIQNGKLLGGNKDDSKQPPLNLPQYSRKSANNKNGDLQEQRSSAENPNSPEKQNNDETKAPIFDSLNNLPESNIINNSIPKNEEEENNYKAPSRLRTGQSSGASYYSKKSKLSNNVELNPILQNNLQPKSQSRSSKSKQQSYGKSCSSRSRTFNRKKLPRIDSNVALNGNLYNPPMASNKKSDISGGRKLSISKAMSVKSGGFC